MAKVAAEVGSTANRYQILAKLAVGGMAEIFLARGASVAGLDRYCVLKRVLRERARDAQFVQMFLDEARLAAQLQHPNIASVYDIGMLGDSYFFTMEYVHGETVRALMQRAQGLRRPLPLACVLTIIAGAASGLHHAHGRNAHDGKPLGIVHRDVSPSNLMVSFEGNTKVVDFGVAKADNRVETKAGTVKGKISYLSPEQCRGERVDRRSDMFSLGICMWEMLTGARLYRRASDFETMTAIVHEPPPPPSSKRHELPREVDDIVHKLLAKDVRDRYQTADEVVEAIEHASIRAGTVLSTSAVARLLRDLFGARAEPWLELEVETKPQEVVTLMSRPVPEAHGLDEEDPVESSLASVIDLSVVSVYDGDAHVDAPGLAGRGHAAEWQRGGDAHDADGIPTAPARPTASAPVVARAPIAPREGSGSASGVRGSGRIARLRTPSEPMPTVGASAVTPAPRAPGTGPVARQLSPVPRSDVQMMAPLPALEPAAPTAAPGATTLRFSQDHLAALAAARHGRASHDEDQGPTLRTPPPVSFELSIAEPTLIPERAPRLSPSALAAAQPVDPKLGASTLLGVAAPASQATMFAVPGQPPLPLATRAQASAALPLVPDLATASDLVSLPAYPSMHVASKPRVPWPLLAVIGVATAIGIAAVWLLMRGPDAPVVSRPEPVIMTQTPPPSEPAPTAKPTPTAPVATPAAEPAKPTPAEPAKPPIAEPAKPTPSTTQPATGDKPAPARTDESKPAAPTSRSTDKPTDPAKPKSDDRKRVRNEDYKLPIAQTTTTTRETLVQFFHAEQYANVVGECIKINVTEQIAGVCVLSACHLGMQGRAQQWLAAVAESMRLGLENRCRDLLRR